MIITFVEFKHYSKLVNIIKKKWIHGYRTQTSGYQGAIYGGGWEVLIIVCKIGYKDVLYNTREYSHSFVIAVNGV